MGAEAEEGGASLREEVRNQKGGSSEDDYYILYFLITLSNLVFMSSGTRHRLNGTTKTFYNSETNATMQCFCINILAI